MLVKDKYVMEAKLTCKTQGLFEVSFSESLSVRDFMKQEVESKGNCFLLNVLRNGVIENDNPHKNANWARKQNP